ncbi:YgiQ family radical SAM protein [Steroidobacter flavus]|uniref:YgiQ family radical SAM protein n=1 Tax=Steroidobacter flavus TaxID=1842136 RepID=A0ABV8SU76_9GAMM
MQPAPRELFSYRKHWASRFGTAPFLPMSKEEMDALGWDSCDIIVVTGDAYVDHPSFGMAIIGRVLEAQGFRVGILAQPDWRSAEDFTRLGKPNLFFGITAGNMDSMVNRYTSDRRIRSDDAYTPAGEGGKRPDRSVIVYSQRVREAFNDVPIVIGGIEASLRRIAHFDYWSEKVRRSVLLDAKADLLVYGNGERQIVEIAHRLAKGQRIDQIDDLRGTAFVRHATPEGWTEIDSTSIDEPGPLNPPIDPYAANDAKSKAAMAAASHNASTGNISSTGAGSGAESSAQNAAAENISSAGGRPGTEVAAHSAAAENDSSAGAALGAELSVGGMPAKAAGAGEAEASAPACATAAKQPVAKVVKFHRHVPTADRAQSVIRMPSFEAVRDDAVLYAHASRILHLESNPGNARSLVQRHGNVDVWLNPPPLPLSMKEMDAIYELPYRRIPHPFYGEQKGANKIPAYEMIRFSIAIQRGCFGGCTFCSITEHEGRIIQNRSENSIIKEIETIRDSVPGFTGVISDLGGPTANMYRLACKSREIETACRRPSCVFPGICPNLNTNHTPLINLYRRARALPGIKKILIGSGVRYDLAVESPEYVKELVQHHVGGYLKIAPEAIGEGPLSKMMKPGVGTYYRFKELFEKFSKEAGKEQYLIPYFIAAHPGTTDEDMLELALWLKHNGYRADQVQAFLPSPMATATAMWHSGKNPLRKVTHGSEEVHIPKGLKVRRLHKAFLRWHDANNWPILRDALRRMGRADLIGAGKQHLIPAWQPLGTGDAHEGRRSKHAPRAGEHENKQAHDKRRHGAPQAARREDPRAATANGQRGYEASANAPGAKRAGGQGAISNAKRTGAQAAASNAKRAGAPQAAPKPTKFRTQHTGLKGVRMPRSK